MRKDFDIVRGWRNIGLAGLVAALFLTVSVLDKPSARDGAAITAATVAAAEAYDRAMERYGDPAVAMELSNMEFERVMKRWETGENPSAAHGGSSPFRGAK